MSNVNWMEEDDNDYEMASCLDACGKLFRCKCNKTERPLLVSEDVPEVRLNADHFDVHQVSGWAIASYVTSPLLPNFDAIVPYTRSLSYFADVPTWTAPSAVLPGLRQPATASGHRFSPWRHYYVSVDAILCIVTLIFGGILRSRLSLTQWLNRIGKAGLEKHLGQSDAVAIEQMVFVEDQVAGGSVALISGFAPL